MTAQVELFDASPEEWNGFVRTHPGWTHFHLYQWRSVIERVFGHECLYLASRDELGRLVGVLPLVRVRSRIFGHYLVSMPFLNYGGPLGAEAAARALAAWAIGLARDDRVDLLELRSRAPLPLDMPVSHRKITVLLDLPPGGPDALWATFSTKVRTKVRRARKEGVCVRFGTDQMTGFFAVFSRHMRDLGTPTLPRQLFEAIADSFPEGAWFGCAYLGEQPMACGCALQWGDELEMTWSSALPESNRMQVNMCLYWAFMERAARAGLRVFNFGRCTPGSGTHQFKLQWGSRDESLWWYHYAAGRRVATPSPGDRAFSWGPQLWKRLPLPVANLLGPKVVRSIP